MYKLKVAKYLNQHGCSEALKLCAGNNIYKQNAIDLSQVVSAIENDGGIICSAPNLEQRRHADDIRPLSVSEQSINEPANTAEEQTTHLASNGAYRQEHSDQPDNDIDNALRKSSRKRYPNPKYADFDLN